MTIEPGKKRIVLVFTSDIIHHISDLTLQEEISCKMEVPLHLILYHFTIKSAKICYLLLDPFTHLWMRHTPLGTNRVKRNRVTYPFK